MPHFNTVIPCGHFSTSDWHLCSTQCKFLGTYFENQCRKSNCAIDVGILTPCGSWNCSEKLSSNLQTLTWQSLTLIQFTCFMPAFLQMLSYSPCFDFENAHLKNVLKHPVHKN